MVRLMIVLILKLVNCNVGMDKWWKSKMTQLNEGQKGGAAQAAKISPDVCLSTPDEQPKTAPSMTRSLQSPHLIDLIHGVSIWVPDACCLPSTSAGLRGWNAPRSLACLPRRIAPRVTEGRSHFDGGGHSISKPHEIHVVDGGRAWMVMRWCEVTVAVAGLNSRPNHLERRR